MSNRPKDAVKYFEGMCNCCQAVICAYAPELGISQETAVKIGCGFGGGARAKELCGAVSGAIVALGLANGPGDTSDQAAQDITYAKTLEFNDTFIKMHGSIVCRDLIDRDICSQLVEDACEILDEII